MLKLLKKSFLVNFLTLLLLLILIPSTYALAAPTYSAHVENIGWMSPVSNGAVAGTEGRALQMEAFTISLDGADGNIEYNSHVQNKGWLTPVSNGQISGTVGEHLRVEALNITLSGNIANENDIYYRTHVADIGWMGWAKNGENAGTTGGSKQVEAIQVVLVPKGSAAPGSTDDSFREFSQVQQTGAIPGLRTVKNFLQTSLLPIGNTSYVYGGGWNAADNAAGPAAVYIGVYPQWKAFYSLQNANYDYRNYKFQILNGLDCSGYVGWTVYNILNTQNNGVGEVYWADRQANWYAQKGYGSYTPYGQVSSFEPGDIVSLNNDAHVYIVIGQCGDGSIVLAHSSPPGVMLSGTLNPDGSQSEATRLARTYMNRYYPDYYNKYHAKLDRGNFYKVRCSKFRWGDNFVGDPDGIRNYNAYDVLRILYNE